MATCNVHVEDITDRIECSVAAGNYIFVSYTTIMDGSILYAWFKNCSEKSFTLKEFALIDGQNGITYILDKNHDVKKYDYFSYRHQVGYTNMHLPITCRCKIEYEGKTYIKDVVVSKI